MSEKEIEKELCNFFESYGFETKQQVYCKKDGKRNFLDVIVYKGDFAFGIELKTKAIDSGTKMAKWCKQAARYSRIEWKDFGRIPIFITPSISDKFNQEETRSDKFYRHDIDTDTHHNINSFITSTYGIGEFRRLKDKRVLMYNNFCIAYFYNNGQVFINNKNYIDTLKKINSLENKLY